MAVNKTKQTDESVVEFIQKVENKVKRDDSYKLIEIFKSVSGFEPKMWGPTIIGFGTYHYKYDSGHEGDAPLAAFSPRKTSIVLYFATAYKDRELLLPKLGKHKSSVSCVYVSKLADIDTEILKTMIENSMATVTTPTSSKC